MIVPCDECGADVSKPPSKVFAHNFCNNACRMPWLCRNHNKPDTKYGWKRNDTATRNAKSDAPGRSRYRKRSSSTEHRKIAEAHLGRKLERLEYVHHIDGNKRNNAIENLQVVTPQQHADIHYRGTDVRTGRLVELCPE